MALMANLDTLHQAGLVVLALALPPLLLQVQMGLPPGTSYPVRLLCTLQPKRVCRLWMSIAGHQSFAPHHHPTHDMKPFEPALPVLWDSFSYQPCSSLYMPYNIGNVA